MSIVTPAATTAVMSTRTQPVASDIKARKIELPQRQEQRPTASKGKLDWQSVKTVTDPEIGVMVELQRLPLSKPRFSISICGIGQNGPTRSIRANVQADQGKAVVPVMFGMRIARMVDDLLLIAQDEAQKVEDRYMDRKIAFEEKVLKPANKTLSPLGQGKTQEQKDAKKKRHENNLAARRAEDSARTSKTKGGK